MSRPTSIATAVAALPVIYQCPECEEHTTDRRCAECNLFTRRLGLGGHCPHCDETVLLDDLTTQTATSTTGTYTENLTSSGRPRLRTELQRRGIGYLLAIASTTHVRTAAGKRGVGELAARLPERAWQLRSAGAGSKGHRDYQWAWIGLLEPDAPGWHWLLNRRHRRTGELAFYRAYAPHYVNLAALVGVAGRRWTSWHRWTVLSILAHAFLTITAAHEHTRRPTHRALIRLTVNEIRRLFTQLLTRPP